MLSLQSILRKGVSVGYVGSIENLKGSKDLVDECESLVEGPPRSRVRVRPRKEHVDPVAVTRLL